MGKEVSRRDFLREVEETAAALAAMVASPLLAMLPVEERTLWYEVVQDMRREDRWHVNLFAAKEIGDLEKGKHLGHRVVRVEDVETIKGQLKYPARLQFQDGRTEQIAGGRS